MMNFKKLQSVDPLKRTVEKESGGEELSPMDPPEAYDLPESDAVAYQELHPVLQKFVDEHNTLKHKIDEFEATLLELKDGVKKSGTHLRDKFSEFFSFIDTEIVRHHLKEEKILFPVLQEKLMATGNHSKGLSPKTAIDMLEDDHVKIMQYLALTFNLMGLSARLPDPKSAMLTMDVALEQGFSLIELLRLHIYREDNVVFPLAQKYLRKEAMDLMLKPFEAYSSY